MSRSPAISRELIPGTKGWTVNDLDDPHVEAAWEAGNYEIIEGVLATMPPAFLDNSLALPRLVLQVQIYLMARGLPPEFGYEADLVLSETRLPKADAIYVTEADKRKQMRSPKRRKRKGLKFGRMVVAPTLVIENISRGHEVDDRVVKRRFYAEAGIPNYWILDVYQKSLECLVLKSSEYALDQIGRGRGKVTPACFPGLTIELAGVWSV